MNYDATRSKSTSTEVEALVGDIRRMTYNFSVARRVALVKKWNLVSSVGTSLFVVSLLIAPSDSARAADQCITFNGVDVVEWDGELRERLSLEANSKKPREFAWTCPWSTELAGKKVVHTKQLTYSCPSGRCDDSVKIGEGQLWYASERVAESVEPDGEDGTTGWDVAWRLPRHSLEFQKLREGVETKYAHLRRMNASGKGSIAHLKCTIEGRDYWVDISADHVVTAPGQVSWVLRLSVDRLKKHKPYGFRYDEPFAEQHCLSDQEKIEVPF